MKVFFPKYSKLTNGKNFRWHIKLLKKFRDLNEINKKMLIQNVVF